MMLASGEELGPSPIPVARSGERTVRARPGKGVVMSVCEPSIPVVLVARARQQPDGGREFAKTSTWVQVHGRPPVIAERRPVHGSMGDRSAISAPHGLDHPLALCGATQTGFIAVPLSKRRSGGHDGRVSGPLPGSQDEFARLEVSA